MKVYTRSQPRLISFVERQQRVHSTKGGDGNYASILPMHSMLEADIRDPHFSTSGMNFRYVCPIYKDIFIDDWF